MNSSQVADAAAIETLVRQQGENFKARDVSSQLASWDSDYPNLTLLPTERAAPLKGWAEIREYYETMMPRFGAKRWDINSFKLDFLGEDWAFAFVLLEGEALTSLDDLYPDSGDGSGIWQGRVTYIVRRTAAGWKIVHCEDSTLDLFRAYQLWDHHKATAAKVVELLATISSPNAGS